MTARKAFLFAFVAALALTMAGCEEPPKGPVSVTVGSIPSAPPPLNVLGAYLNGSGQPVVSFTAVDATGAAITNICPSYPCTPPTTVTFGIAKLVPGSSAPSTYNTALGGSSIAAGNASVWQSYLNHTSGSGSTTNIKPTTEPSAGHGSFLAGGTLNYANGVYTYTFNANIGGCTATTCNGYTLPGSGLNLAVVDMSYQPSFTHRVSVEVSGITGSNGATVMLNATCDFVPATANAKTPCGSGLPLTRDIVDVASCNECHNQLVMHGTRYETKYCVVCHNPGNQDSGTTSGYSVLNATGYSGGNTVDLKVFIHRLHNGSVLPSVKDGSATFMGTSTNYNANVFPQMMPSKALLAKTATSPYFPTCTKCHGPASSTAPNADNWKNNPTIEACASCHDNVVFDGTVTAGTYSGSPNWKMGHLGGAQTDNSLCASCHAANVAGASAPVDKMHGYYDNLKTAAGYFQYNILNAALNTSTGQLTATISVTNPAPGATFTYYDIQQDSLFCGVFNSGAGTCTTSNGSLTLGLSFGATEHVNGGSGSIITPASVVSLNLLNPLNYSSGAAAQGNPTPPSYLGTVTGNACGSGQTSSVASGNCTFTVTWTTASLPASTLSAFKNLAAGTFTLALYGAPKVPNIANDSIVVVGAACATTSLGSSPIGTAAAAASTPTPATRYPCVSVSVPVTSITADFQVPSGGCAGGCVALNSTNGGRRVAALADNTDVRQISADHNNGNTGGSCDTCHGILMAHGGSRANNVQICVNCHNPNNTDLDDRVVTSTNVDGLREHSVDFKVMIHGIHAGATTNSLSGLTTLNGQKRLTGQVIYGYPGGAVNDYAGAWFPGHLDNCLNCHVSNAFTLPLQSVVLPTTVSSVPAAANQWEAMGHTMTLGAAGTCTAGSTTTPGVDIGSNLICMLGAYYANPSIMPVVVTAYGTGAALPSPLTAGTSYYVVTSTPATGAGNVGTFQLSATKGGTPITLLTTGSGTFAIGPANMNSSSDDLIWTPTVAVCTSCHDSATAAQHMLYTGFGIFDPLIPGGISYPTPNPLVGGTASAFLNFNPTLAASTPGAVTPSAITGGSPVIYSGIMTKSQWTANASAGNGQNGEFCSTCHGPGGVADVSVVHSFSPQDYPLK